MSNCAQVAPLTGGLRDVNLPKITQTNPSNSKPGFKSNIIELIFDEYVQVKDLTNQLIITPSLKEMPLVEARGKRITIKFGEELRKNTTYRIFFGKAISDMHEGNVLENYEFVFSTGDTIDSLTMMGTTVNAFNLKPEKDILVGLYTENSSDSVIYNEKPLYFTKSDVSGNFKFKNLPAGKFKLYAYYDNNKNMNYDAGNEMVGFSSNQVEIGSDTIYNMKLFKEDVAKQYIKKAFSPYYGKALVVFNREQICKPKALNSEEMDHICNIPAMNDTCEIFYGNIYDTLKLVIEHGREIKADTVSIEIANKEKADKIKAQKKSPFVIELFQEITGMFPYFDNAVFQSTGAFDQNKLDTSKIRVFCKIDTVKSRLVPFWKFSGCDKIVMNGKLKEGAEYEYLFLPGAFTSVTGMMNDSTKIVFKTSSSEDYSSLSVKLGLPSKENFIAELNNDKGINVAEQYIEQSISSSTEVNIKFGNLKPGSYTIKLTEDLNKNKKWDTGKLQMMKQPEKIYLNQVPVKLLSNWDSETEWNVK